jgi:predicted nuclease of predicted toxin-antitoxin system
MSKRVLLDENLPQRLRFLLPGHTVVTTVFQGWAGLSNGALLEVAENASFDVMITADQNLNYQQNLVGMKLALIALSTNRYSLVVAAAARIARATDEAQPGSFTFVDIGF